MKTNRFTGGFAGFILASLFILFADINMILIDLFFIIWVFASNYLLSFIAVKRVRLNLRQGNYAGVEEYCIALLQNSKMLFQQVVVCDILRDVYLHEGRWQEVQKCKEFILENGGDTYYVAKANAL